MPHFLLDENISLLLIPMDLFSEQDLSVLVQKNKIVTSEFTNHISNCQSQKRRKELLLSRLLFLYIMQTNPVNIRYYNSIKREEEILHNNFFSTPPQTIFLSIAHTDKWMILALYSKSPVGIDIENSRRKTEKIKQYLNEKNYLNGLDESPGISLILWTVYESLYKLKSPVEKRKKILNKVLSIIKENLPQKLNDFNFWTIPAYEYIIFIWKDETTPITGCLIVKDTISGKIKFYSIGKLEEEIKKPCKIELTRLLTCNAKLEISS
ncbi:MAG: hypothetical protein ACP5UA_04335 [Candidatus Hydrogenedens sp.]